MRFPGFIGGSYQMRSITTDCQRSVNLYVDIDEIGTAKEGEVGALLGTPGTKLLLTLPQQPIRGLWAARNYERIFAVSGNGFYELINTSGVWSYVLLGELLTSTGKVGISDNGIEVAIVDGDNMYAYAFEEKSILPQAYRFTTSPANATVGSVYQNNAFSFTVLSTITAGTILMTTGSGGPTPSGTLTLDSGTGDATITYSSFQITSQEPWLPLTAYSVGDTIIPTVGGYIYRCIQAGTSFSVEPIFNTARFSTTVDGTVIWERTTSFREVTDDGFLGSNVIAYQDGYFILARPGTNTVYSSNLYSTSFNALNFTNLSGSTAPVLNLVSLHRNLYIQTSQTTEVYYNAGISPGFPFARINGGYLEQGLAAQYSMTQTANAMFWLGQDKSGNGIVYTTADFLPQRISTFAIEAQFAEYSNISDAIAYTYTEGGHSFYVLNFPEAQKTWCYDISTKFWHERAYNDNGNQVMQKQVYHQFTFGMHFVGDYTNGNIYEQSQNYYTDNGTVIIRKRVSPHLAKDILRMFYSSFQLDIQQGQGLNGTVQGSDPQCMLRFSDDGARTWSNIKMASIGKIGEYKKRAIFRRLGHARDRVFEITISDPVFVAINGAELYLEVGSS